ncbi:MAG TPA: hypothetical protein VN519_06600 [Bryobacteraceae bacterium]|nr:hypothetical protein [Bryobacteraceae bacterium]
MATESITAIPKAVKNPIPERYRLTEEEMVAQCREAERQLLDAAAAFPAEAEMYHDAIRRLWIRMDEARENLKLQAALMQEDIC